MYRATGQYPKRRHCHAKINPTRHPLPGWALDRSEVGDHQRSCGAQQSSKILHHFTHDGLGENIQKEVGAHDVVVSAAVMLENVAADALDLTAETSGCDSFGRLGNHPGRQVDDGDVRAFLGSHHGVLAAANADVKHTRAGGYVSDLRRFANSNLAATVDIRQPIVDIGDAIEVILETAGHGVAPVL